MKKYLILFTAFLLPSFAFATTTVFTTSGTWTDPAGVTLITCDAWGAGGTGAPNRLSSAGAGGGGGGFAEQTNITVVPGNVYSVTAGAVTAGVPSNGTAAGDSMCVSSSTVLAKGGGNAFRFTQGAGGAAGSEIGTTVHSGGSGNVNNGADSSGTGGGGGAGTTADGSQGSADNTTGGAGGAVGGGAGGTGAAGTGSNPGNAKAGGGSGGGSSSSQGGLGSTGEVDITYTIPASPTVLIKGGHTVIKGGHTVIK